MELLTLLLSALLGILSPVGFGVDQVVETAIQDQLEAAEALDVRIDNTPNYQYLQGRADRIRIAGRGLYPIENFRIAVFEVETDAVALDPNSLRQGRPELEHPLQAMFRLVLTEADLNRALRSDQVANRLDDLNLDFFSPGAAQYDVVDPQVEFLENDRIRLQATLQQQVNQSTNPPNPQNVIAIETGINLVSGRQIQLIDPAITFNGNPVPAELLNYFAAGISQLLDLSKLESMGITTRALKLEVEGDQLTLVSFLRVEPDATVLK